MGVLGTFRDSVTLVNRTSRVLNCRFDGEDIKIQPGETPNFPKIAVPYAKTQNVLKGSEHPYDPRQKTFLVAILGTKEDCSPISDETLARADKKPQFLDRDGEHYGIEMQETKLKKAGYTMFDAAAHVGAAMDINNAIE